MSGPVVKEMKAKPLVSISAALLILAILIGRQSADSVVHGQTLNKAAVIVRFGEGEIENLCVAFEEESISGLDLLTRSGLDVELRVEGFGSAVCGIGGSGCVAGDCFCQCAGGSSCVYWSYWHQQEDGWDYSSAGASSTKVVHGVVDGWSWGPGSINSAIQPPLTQFEEICGLESQSTAAVNQPVNSSGPSVVSIAVFSGIALLIAAGLVIYKRKGKSIE